MDKQPATVTIGRTTSNQPDEDFITIRIKVGNVQHRVQLSLKDYALATTGMIVPGEYDSHQRGA